MLIFLLTGYGHVFGQDGYSWAWDLPSGELLSNGTVRPSGYSHVKEKTIYMIVDCKKNRISFYAKGIQKFHAFTGKQILQQYAKQNLRIQICV